MLHAHSTHHFMSKVNGGGGAALVFQGIQYIPACHASQALPKEDITRKFINPIKSWCSCPVELNLYFKIHWKKEMLY